MNRLDQHLECPICYVRFETPKQLPCQHTICLQCLERIAGRRQSLTCPECRQEHTVPAGGVSGFPSNITIQRVLEAAHPPNVPSLPRIRYGFPSRTTLLSHQFDASNDAAHRMPQYHRQSNTVPEIIISPTAAPFPSREPTNVDQMVPRQDLETQIALEIPQNETRQGSRNEREIRETAGVFNKIRNTFRRFKDKILDDHVIAVVRFIAVFFVINFTRLIAGAAKLSSGCPLERQAAVYLFVKFWIALFFWGFFIIWLFRKTLRNALNNPCTQFCLVLASLFSIAWLCVGTVWIMANFSSIYDQCAENGKWNGHFINYALFLTVVDYIGLLVFLFFSGYEFCEM